MNEKAAQSLRFAIFVYDNDNMHLKIKIKAEIWNPGSLKSGFITPPLTEK